MRETERISVGIRFTSLVKQSIVIFLISYYTFNNIKCTYSSNSTNKPWFSINYWKLQSYIIGTGWHYSLLINPRLTSNAICRHLCLIFTKYNNLDAFHCFIIILLRLDIQYLYWLLGFTAVTYNIFFVISNVTHLFL